MHWLPFYICLGIATYLFPPIGIAYLILLIAMFIKRDEIIPIYERHFTERTIPPIDIEPAISAEFSLFMYNKRKYLNSEEWYNKRLLVLGRDNHSCKRCNSSHNLVIHHLSHYNHIGNEPPEALITLCQSCHQIQHDFYGYPTTLNEYKSWNVTLI